MKKLTILGITALTASVLFTPLSVQAAPFFSGNIIQSGSSGNIHWGIISGGNNCPSLPGNGNIQFPQFPDFSIPGLPGITIPGTPDCDTPENSVPDTDIPDTETPDVNLPENSQPDEDAPETNTPDSNLPEQDVPENNRPENNKPGTGKPETDRPETDQPETDQPEEDSPEEDTESQNRHFLLQVISLVNAERAKEGLSPLSLDTSMEAAAMVRAKEIQASFSHTRPNGSSFATALKEAGVSYRRAGENIAWGQKTPKEVVNAWMNSSGHRANIMNPQFNRIGVGYLTNASGTPYWVQLFAN